MKLINLSFILLLSRCEELTAFTSSWPPITISGAVPSLDTANLNTWNNGANNGNDVMVKSLTSFEAANITLQIKDKVEKTTDAVAAAQAEGIKKIATDGATICELPSSWYAEMTDEDKADIKSQMVEVVKSSADLNILTRLVEPPSRYEEDYRVPASKQGKDTTVPGSTTSMQAIYSSPGLGDRSSYGEFLKEGTITAFNMMTLCNIFIKDVIDQLTKHSGRRIRGLDATNDADDGAELRTACSSITNNTKDTLSILSLLKKINKASEMTYALKINVTDLAVEMVDIMREEDINAIDTTTGLCADAFYKNPSGPQLKKLEEVVSKEGGLTETVSGLDEVVNELGNVTEGYKLQIQKVFNDLDKNEDGQLDGYVNTLPLDLYDTNGDGTVDKDEFINVTVNAYPSIENHRTNTTTKTFSTAYQLTAVTAPIKEEYSTLHLEAVKVLKNSTVLRQYAWNERE